MASNNGALSPDDLRRLAREARADSDALIDRMTVHLNYLRRLAGLPPRDLRGEIEARRAKVG